MTVQSKEALSLVTVKMTVHRIGDEVFETWLKDVSADDTPLLLPGRIRKVEQCLKEVPSEWKLRNYRFTRRVCEFDFSHCGDGYNGSFSAMADWCFAVGTNYVFENYLRELYEIGIRRSLDYVWADGKREEYVFTTLWKTYDMTDDEDEDYGEFKTELHGCVNVTNLIGLLHVPAGVP